MKYVFIGAEVAKYTSEHLPEFIKTSEPWIKGKMEEAFIDGFLNFDDTLRSEKVIETLKQLAGTKTDTDGNVMYHVFDLYIYVQAIVVAMWMRTRRCCTRRHVCQSIKYYNVMD